jgi:hypothetical protein
MSEHVFMHTVLLFLGTIITVVAIRYWALTRRPRPDARSEDVLRSLAEKAETAQSESARALTAIQADLADVRSRLGAVEKILKSVE